MGQRQEKAATGFTLIELLVVLAIGAVLLAVGVPSFTYMVDRNRVAGEVNQMLADLALTRSEALARRGRVIVCRTTALPTDADSSITCSGAATSWDTGWIVFADDPAGATAFQRDPATEPLIRFSTRTSRQVGIAVLAPAAGIAGLTVTADGTVFQLDGTPLNALPGGLEPIRIDFRGGDAANFRSVCIATTGRARTSNSYGACT